MMRAFLPLLILALFGCTSKQSFWWDKPPQKQAYVIIQPGETLTLIAERHHVRMKDLAEYNGLNISQSVPVGTLLYLPSSTFHDNSDIEALDEGMDLQTQEAPEGEWHNPLIVKEEVIMQPLSASASSSEPQKKGIASTKSDKKKEEKQELWAWPVDGKILENFKHSSENSNEGITISAPSGSPVKAARDGLVIYVGHNVDGYGKLILLKHEDHFETTYAHSQKILVKKGQRVKKGQTIALVGKTGGVDSDQLYFEIRKGLKALDPLKFLPKKA